MDRQHYRGSYRPPWLWSVVEMLKRTSDEDAIIVSHPVAPGGDRGAHNCGECDDEVYDAIKAYDETGDAYILDEPDCECRQQWRELLDRERSWHVPLA